MTGFAELAPHLDAAILAAFGLVLWKYGFGPGDRELFRMNKSEIADLSLPDPSTGGDAPR